MEEIEQVNELTQVIIKSAIEVHQALGPDLPESEYAAALSQQLSKSGLTLETPPPFSSDMDEVQADADCKIDLLVDSQVMLQVLSVDQLTQDYQDKLSACLVRSGQGVGLLINFKVEKLELGIKRVINYELYNL